MVAYWLSIVLLGLGFYMIFEVISKPALERLSIWRNRRRQLTVFLSHPRTEDVRDIIRRSRAILGTRGQNWTRYTHARSALRSPVHAQSIQAVTFSLPGAIVRVVAPEPLTHQSEPFEVANVEELIKTTIGFLTCIAPARFQNLDELNDKGSWFEVELTLREAEAILQEVLRAE